jgi:hypothetical protein
MLKLYHIETFNIGFKVEKENKKNPPKKEGLKENLKLCNLE